MTTLYSDSDYLAALRQRRKLYLILWGATAAFLICLALIVVFYLLLPYNDPSRVWYIVGACAAAVVYIFFLFPFAGICLKRSRAYCKMLRFLSEGYKENAVLPFSGIDDWITYDGVDVNVATFSIKNRKRDEEMTRQIYVDGEKDFPPFEEGKRYRLILQGNLLIGYEPYTEEEA